MPSRFRRKTFVPLMWCAIACLGAHLWSQQTNSQTVSESRQIEAADYRDTIESLREIIRYEVEAKSLPALSVGVVADGRIVWAEGFGFQDPDRKTPATAQTIYRVGSVSKIFTDMAALQLVDAGKLSLDESVQNYLANFSPENRFSTPITLRQLMSHQAGVVREPPVGHYFDAASPSLQDTVASLNRTSLVYRPGSRTKYSNAGVSVVGKILEAVTGDAYDVGIEQSIFVPVGMRSSAFRMSSALEPRLATGYMWTYDDRRFPAPAFPLGTAPAGNLYSTVVDLSQFWVSMLDGPNGVLSDASWRAMTQAVENGDGSLSRFGLGFQIGVLDGERKIGHGGAVYGFSTQTEALPERRIAVTIACALDGSNGVLRRLSDHILKCLVARETGAPAPEYARTVNVVAERARRLAGRFRNGPAVLDVVELAGRVYIEEGELRHELRARPSDGTLIVDDVFDFGAELVLDTEGRLRYGGEAFERTMEIPPAADEDFRGLIGEYGWDHNTLYVLERNGQLYALIEWFYYYPLRRIQDDLYAFPNDGLYHGETLKFERDTKGEAQRVIAAEVDFPRREVGTRHGETFRITPVQPIDTLREAAFSATPPAESGDFRDTDLLELVSLDSTIQLDIRYATTNNFTGSVFYQQPRAFLQRPAADAVVRAHGRLRDAGLGILIHDAYRPWHVTKMFWDATPDSLKDFVANPANGSRHNRGCAVDLTLYDLKTGDPIEMVAGYDEFSARSYPMYPGGTDRQRWYRYWLRRTMEEEGFSVYEFEWWHFDYVDWRKYRIGNATFEQLLKSP